MKAACMHAACTWSLVEASSRHPALVPHTSHCSHSRTRSHNPEIPTGKCLVVGTQEGLHARARRDARHVSVACKV
eukprot:362705-Chlamydomonas_euryale.AAC.8